MIKIDSVEWKKITVDGKGFDGVLEVSEDFKNAPSSGRI